DASGAPATGYAIDWGPFADGDQQGFVATSEHGGPGMELLHVQASQVRDYRVNAVVHIPHDPPGAAAGDRSPVIRVYGGTPSIVLPMSVAANLVVGERRPINAIGLAPTFTFQHFPDTLTTSHVPVTYSTDDGAVATVDADGVVTAVAPGSTA